MKREIFRSVAILSLFMLAACGGGDKSGPPTLAGVAAAGSPLVGTVSMKDSSTPAKELSMPIAQDGSFSFNLSGLTAPFLLKAAGTANGTSLTLYSFASGPGIANLNPLSLLAVAKAHGSSDLASLYASPDPTKLRALSTALPSAVSAVRTAFQPTLAKFGSADVDFISDRYIANHQGLDLLLDLANFSTSNSSVTVDDKTSSSTANIPLSSLGTSTVDIIAAPPTAGSVIVLPKARSVYPGGSLAFSAIIAGTADQNVQWSVVEENGGTITTSGVYAAPATPGTYHVKATSVTDSAKSATATVDVVLNNFFYLTETSPGIYEVKGGNLTNLGGISLTINYDPHLLSNPRVVQSNAMLAGMSVANTKTPGFVKWAMISTTPINGSGTVITTTFDVLSAIRNTPTMSVQVVNPNATVPDAPPNDVPPPAPLPVSNSAVVTTSSSVGAQLLANDNNI